MSPDDGGVTTAGYEIARPVDATGGLRPDLEEFWPSRRGHAYDEFCR